MFDLGTIRRMNESGTRTKGNILEGAAYVGKPKKTANNTWRWQDAEGNTYWRLHRTDVVTRLANGTFVLTSGGWQTSTTRDRINQYSPACLYQTNGEWYLASRLPDGAIDWNTRYPFQDGMAIDEHGVPFHTPREIKEGKGKRWHLAV